MKKIYIILFALLLAACAGEVPAPMSIIENIPTTPPRLAADVELNRALYTQKVDILFKGNEVQLSQLPAGITATTDGAFVTLHSLLAGVE